MADEAPFTIIARTSVSPARREEFRIMMGRLAASSREEPGTLSFTCYAERENPDDYWMVETYRDHESHMFHRRNSMDPIRDQMDGLFSTWPHRRYCVPIVGGDHDLR